MQEMIADQRALPQYECMHDFDHLSKSSIAFHEFLDFKDPLTSISIRLKKPRFTGSGTIGTMAF